MAPKWLDDFLLAAGEEETRRALMTALEAGDFEVGIRPELATILKSGDPKRRRRRR